MDLVTIFISLVLGIVFFYFFEIHAIATLATSIICIIFYIILIKKRKLLVLIIFFFIGGSLVSIFLNNSILSGFINEEIEILGVVKDVLEYDSYSKVILEVENAIYEDKTVITKEKTFFYSDDNYKIGDRIKCRVLVEEIKPNTNKNLFNYKLYLLSKRIYSKVLIINNVEKINENNINLFENLSNKISNKTKNDIDKYIKNSAIIKGIVYGDDSFLDQTELNLYRNLGLAHILAVSGLHIGIVFSFFIFIFKLFNFNKIISIIISNITIWIYGYIIKFPISVLRASLMFSTLAFSYIFYRKYNMLNSLSLAGIIIIFINPMSVFNVGFQLSFGIVTAIILLNNRILNMFNKKNYVTKIFSLLLSIQIGILPVLAYYFNLISISSIISNFILVPIFSIIIILSFALIIISNFSSHIAIILGKLIDSLIVLTNFISNNIFKYFNFSFEIKSPNIYEIFIYYLIVVVIFKLIDLYAFNNKAKKMIFSYLIIVVIISSIYSLIQEPTSIEFLDIGQGDSCLINYKNKHFIIDSGSNFFSEINTSQKVVIPYLKKKGVRKIDGIFISHFDYDHCGGIIDIIEELNVGKVFLGYIDLENQLCFDIIKRCSELGTEVKLLKSGDELKVDKDFNIKVLNPNFKINSMESDNNLSLVLLLKINNNKILFTGDIESYVENKIVNNYKLDVDIVKVAHHGSNTSSSLNFLQKIKPKDAIVCVGKNNYNHPSLDVINRYEKQGVNIFRTDIDGQITINIFKNDYKVNKILDNELSFYDFLINYNYYILSLIIYFIISILLIIKYKSLEVIYEL